MGGTRVRPSPSGGRRVALAVLIGLRLMVALALRPCLAGGARHHLPAAAAVRLLFAVIALPLLLVEIVLLAVAAVLTRRAPGGRRAADHAWVGAGRADSDLANSDGRGLDVGDRAPDETSGDHLAPTIYAPGCILPTAWPARTRPRSAAASPRPTRVRSAAGRPAADRGESAGHADRRQARQRCAHGEDVGQIHLQRIVGALADLEAGVGLVGTATASTSLERRARSRAGSASAPAAPSGSTRRSSRRSST